LHAGCPAHQATYPNGRSGLIRDFSRAVPIRSCSRWGLPCRFRRRKRGALLPHRFTLAAAKRNAPRRSLLCGTVPGVLSPPDVIRHRLSVEPGLSSPAAFRHWRGAAVRPTDRIAMGICAYCVKVSYATALRRPESVLSTRLPWGAVAQAAFRSTHVMSAAWKDRLRHRREPAENGAGMP